LILNSHFKFKLKLEDPPLRIFELPNDSKIKNFKQSSFFERLFKCFLLRYLMGKSIGVISLKGGVGKTSTAISLGSAFAGFGKKVLLIDANFSAPNLGLHLNIIEPDVTLHHVLRRKAHINSAIYRVNNLDLLPSSIYQNIQIDPLKLKNYIGYLKSKYDIIIIDSSPSLNEETLAAMLASDEILVVATPDHPTLSTTLKAIKLAKQRDVPIVGLILNKVHNKNFELTFNDIENTSEVPILAVIPNDIDFMKSLSNFTSYVDYKPNSHGSKEFYKLAATLIGEKYRPFSIKDFLRKLSPPRQEINREIFYTELLSSPPL